MPEARSLEVICNNSTIIVTARLSKYIQSPEKIFKLTTISNDPWTILYIAPIKLPGKYLFYNISTIIGQSPASISLDLGYISSFVYSSYDKTKDSIWQLKEGSRVVLFLKKTPDGKYVPTDELMPFLPVGIEAKVHENEAASSIDSVVHLLLTSLKDPGYRRINTHALRKLINSQIPIALANYVDDPDINIRDNVLYCLGTNKQVAAIPLIAKFASEHQAQCSTTLRDYWSEDAQQYLKPLLFNCNYWVRLSAGNSVGRFSDYKTVPYLLFALNDHDQQKLIPTGADVILYFLLSKEKQEDERNDDQFSMHRKERIPTYYVWWNDELLGKHLDKTPKEDLDAPPTANAPVDKLNPALFDPRVDIRRKAMVLLQKRADASSIPYLIMALRDPDQEVAYSAYRKVNLLAGLTTTVQTAAQFSAKQKELADTIMEWWQMKYAGH